MMNHTGVWMSGWLDNSMGAWMWFLPLGGLLVLVLMVLLIIRRFKKRSRVHDALEVTCQKKRKET
jgi:TRAP-type C4-dicarboxylate transport system permease small subunit